MYIFTCFEPSSHLHTLGTVHYRHNIIVYGISSESPREHDSCHWTPGGVSVSVDQVGVGWVCTIVNGAVVPWLKECALHKCTVDIKLKVSAICGERSILMLTPINLSNYCIGSYALHHNNKKKLINIKGSFVSP